MKNFELRDGKSGRELLATGPWSPRLTMYILDHRIKELALNYSAGWKGNDLSFLQDLPHLEAVTIIDWNIEDLSPIHALHSLRTLQVSTYCKTRIDFTQFPQLEDCALEWRTGARSVFSCRSLKRLYLNRYKGKDTSDFSALTKLESLTIANGPVRDLKGLATLRSLRSLAVYNLRKLASLSGVEALTQLEKLDVDGCTSIGSIQPVAHLTNLVSLAVCSCGSIESFKPLEGLKKLEAVIFYESTNILDGDLSPVKRLPRLSRVAFQQRKHYTHSRADFATT